MGSTGIIIFSWKSLNLKDTLKSLYSQVNGRKYDAKEQKREEKLHNKLGNECIVWLLLHICM
jgi:hypothetical protein